MTDCYSPLRTVHRLLNTRSWQHYEEHGHWPDIRYESELLDTQIDGFARCVRCPK